VLLWSRPDFHNPPCKQTPQYQSIKPTAASHTSPTMATRRAATPAKQLFNGFRLSQRVQQQQQPCLARGMATITTTAETPNSALGFQPSPTPKRYRNKNKNQQTAAEAPRNPFLTTTQCTLHDFPSFEPTSFVTYPSTHLQMPLRKDILHRAVIYEGDMTRQGTASTKYRSEVHGSNRKIRPQKGTGAARLGDKKSPMLKGGGVAFGPKPRDFSTELPRKVYDQAWRTAISYRYRKGELILVDGELEIDVAEGSLERYMKDLLSWQNMGHGGGRTLFVTAERRHNLFDALEGENMGRHARALEADYVDVKDMLELGRVVIERDALEMLLLEHETDLGPQQKILSQLTL
jgi:large subunit ribosomal protein L4